MGKKLVNEMNVISPKKDLHSREVKFEASDNMDMQNDARRGNMNEPRSHDNKKSSDQENKASTSQAQENPQVEQERRQTIIQEFDMGLDQLMINDEIKLDEKVEDDNCSRASKKESEYVKFYKHYYDKYHAEHPSWTPGQITTIVSLLWKKKKSHEKSTPLSKSGMTSRRSNRPLTAKEAFKVQHKDLTKEEIDQIWTKLPQESKNFWKREGDSYGTGAKLSEVSSVDNCRVPLIVHNAAKSLLNMF